MNADPACLMNVATLGSAGAAIVAALITAWMAVETRRMAEQTKRSVDLEYMPLLGIRNVSVEISPTDFIQIDATRSEPTGINLIKIGIELQNSGRIAVSYQMKSLRETFADRTTDSATFLSRGGLVLPGSSMHFWSSGIELDPPVKSFPATGRIECEFEYKHDERSPPKRLVATLLYVVAGPAPGARTNWYFVDEPRVA